jgi:hypothetical protein
MFNLEASLFSFLSLCAYCDVPGGIPNDLVRWALLAAVPALFCS